MSRDSRMDRNDRTGRGDRMNRGGRVSRGAKAVTCTAAIVALAAAIAVGAGFAGDVMREQGAESLRTSVLEAAKQCCAVEGSWPSSIEYLEEHYGLSINREDYAVTYEAYASNVPPAVRVVPR